MKSLNGTVAALINEEEFKISVRKAGVFRFPNSYHFQSHSHIEYEINYVSNGNCMMTFEQEYVSLKQGDCIIIPSYNQHGFIVDLKRGCKITQVEMSMEIPIEMKSPFPFCSDERQYYVINHCTDIVSLMEQVAKIHRTDRENSYTILQLRLFVLQLMIALAHHITKSASEVEGIKNKKVQWTLNYIHDHYNENISVEEIAKKAGVSSRYLRRCFSKQIGMSCVEYVTVLRINKAKELFGETNKSVTEVAMETGYGSSQYFCRVFKEKVGISPKMYKGSWKE